MPTESARVTQMFESVLNGMPQAKPGQSLVDLGSGDGRIVIAAAQRGLHATGVEINPFLVWKSRRWAKRAGVSEHAKFVCGNIWTAEVGHADIVAVYGREGDGLMAKFRNKLQNELQPNSLVISNHFAIPGWERALTKDNQGLKLYELDRVMGK